MHTINRARRAALLMSLTAIAIVSCESPDQRLVDYAQRASDQQARQNERMAQQAETVARQSQEVAGAAHDLVEQDAAARRELLHAQEKLQHQLQVERSALDRQREAVDVERKAAAQAAVRDPVIARALITAGLILAALLPLLVTVYALRRLPTPGPAEERLTEMLWDDFVLNRPTGRSGEPPHSIEDAPTPRLDGPDQPTDRRSDGPNH
jgi:hypothetical protein